MATPAVSMRVKPTAAPPVQAITPVAAFVSADEPCYLLVEIDLQSPGNRGWHRYQILYVVRGERLAEHRIDLGKRKKDVPQFRVPGGVIDETTGRAKIVETVGRLQDIADWLRAGGATPPEEALRDQPLDLMQRWADQMDARRIARTSRISVPVATKER